METGRYKAVIDKIYEEFEGVKLTEKKKDQINQLVKEELANLKKKFK